MCDSSLPRSINFVSALRREMINGGILQPKHQSKDMLKKNPVKEPVNAGGQQGASLGKKGSLVFLTA